MVIDINMLIKPISKTKPTGTDIRDDFSADSPFMVIKTARADAREAERRYHRGEDHDGSQPYWQLVYDTAIVILQSHSKDLEVCAWLIEALTRLSSFRGLAEGFKLTHDLIERYWETLYPQGENSNKISALNHLNGEGQPGSLIDPINAIIFTHSQENENYALWQYQQAIKLESLQDKAKQQKQIQSGAITIMQIKNVLKQTEESFLETFADSLNHCINQYKKLTRLIDSKCEPNSLCSSNIKNALHNYQQSFEYLTQNPTAKKQVSCDITTKIQRPHQPFSQHSNYSRDEALCTLERIANYYQNTEPHSPVSYLLKKAIRWASLPLPELLLEILNNNDTQEKIFNLIGLEEQQIH